MDVKHTPGGSAIISRDKCPATIAIRLAAKTGVSQYNSDTRHTNNYA